MASDAETTVNHFCKLWEKRNLEEIVAYFTEDAVYHNMPMEPAKGKAAIRRVINTFLPMAKSVRFEILRTASNGKIVFNERIDRFDLGGKQVAVPVAGMFEVTDGKISLWRDYFDLQTWTKQVS